MKKVLHILFLSCLKASELIEKKLHFKLGLTQRLQLKVHKMMCKACTNFEKHAIFIDKSILFSQQAEKQSHSFDEMKELKKKILVKLAENP